MPKIYDGTTGVLKDSDGLAYANCKTAVLNAPYSVSQAYTIFAATAFDDPFQRIVGGSPDLSLNGTPNLRFSAGTLLTGTSTVTYNQRHIFTALGNGTNSAIWYDGNVEATGDAGTNVAGGTIFTRSNASSGTPRAYEFIIYDSDQSSNRTNIEDNINTFYSIY